MTFLLRTAETEAAYSNFKASQTDHRNRGLLNNSSDTVVREFEYWIIIKNNFPYDAIAVDHDLLVPQRVFGNFAEATEAERAEYETILQTLNDEGYYDSLQINFSMNRSVLRHYHIQLLKWKQI